MSGSITDSWLMSSQRSFGNPATTLPRTDFGKLPASGAPFLPGPGVHVADHVPALGMQLGHDFRGVFEPVDVIHLGFHRLIDGRGAQLPLPCR